MPSAKEVEERNLDHSMFRSWRPHCVKGRAEACRHRRSKDDKREAPAVGLDYTRMRSEQEKVEEKCVPIVVLTDEKTKMTTAKVVPNKASSEC